MEWSGAEGALGSSLLVLLLEGDGIDATQSIAPHLGEPGLETRRVTDPAAVAAAAEALWPDVVIINTPDPADAVEVCAALERSDLALPRLVVCPGGPIPGVPAHAFLEQPITPRRLSNRLKKALASQAGRFIRAGDLCVDRWRRYVRCPHGVAHLTPKEVALLSYLMRHAGRTISRVEMMREIWETDFIEDMRTIEVHIRYLRRKIEPDPKRPRYIVTVRRQGYVFRPDEARRP